MELKAIAIDKQIDNVLFGQSDNEIKEVNKKVEFIITNIDKVISINGKKVYHPIVIGKDILYTLKQVPKDYEYLLKENKRKYYYPIQYANIKLKED
jgi:hypothetical protein